jgi:hypothetical protein
LPPEQLHPTARPTHSQLAGNCWLRFDGGALGMISISQATHGRLNDLKIEIDGDLGALV